MDKSPVLGRPCISLPFLIFPLSQVCNLIGVTIDALATTCEQVIQVPLV